MTDAKPADQPPADAEDIAAIAAEEKDAGIVDQQSAATAAAADPETR